MSRHESGAGFHLFLFILPDQVSKTFLCMWKEFIQIFVSCHMKKFTVGVKQFIIFFIRFINNKCTRKMFWNIFKRKSQLFTDSWLKSFLLFTCIFLCGTIKPSNVLLISSFNIPLNNQHSISPLQLLSIVDNHLRKPSYNVTFNKHLHLTFITILQLNFYK